VNDCIHSSDRVHLVGDIARLSRATQVAYYQSSGPGTEVVERRRALRRSRVKDDLMALVDDTLMR
jgi:hypothetical protein